MSGYNDDVEDADGVHALLMSLIVRRIRLQGFLNADHLDSFPEFQRQMHDWLDTGQIVADETVVDGLEQAPAAFAGLFEGRNIGKLVVKLAE